MNRLGRNFLWNLFKLTALATAIALGTTSCGWNFGSSETSRQAPLKPERVMYEWYDDSGPGAVSVKISLAEQKASYWRGDRQIGWSYVSTGKEGHGTRTGTYRIMEKIADKHSNRYGWMENELGEIVEPDARSSDPVPTGLTYMPAPMPYWMRLTSYGVGMHAGPIPKPGQPLSHGCIRLPKAFAPILFEAVKVGTPVRIVP